MAATVDHASFHLLVHVLAAIVLVGAGIGVVVQASRLPAPLLPAQEPPALDVRTIRTAVLIVAVSLSTGAGVLHGAHAVTGMAGPIDPILALSAFQLAWPGLLALGLRVAIAAGVAANGAALVAWAAVHVPSGPGAAPPPMESAVLGFEVLFIALLGVVAWLRTGHTFPGMRAAATAASIAVVPVGGMVGVVTLLVLSVGASPHVH